MLACIPANFNRFRVLASLLHRRSSPESNQTLHDVWPRSWASTLCIHFRGLLPPDGILPGAKFTLRPSLAFSYVGSVTARQSSMKRASAKLCGVVQRNEITELLQRTPPIFGWAAITLAIDPHSSCILYPHPPR